MMPRRVFRLFGALVLSLTVSLPALAADDPAAGPAPGCSAPVWEALNAKAQAQVAYDMAVARTFMNIPDSVLTLTCFSNLVGVSAKQGAAFSGDFTNDLKNKNILPVTGSGDKYECKEIKDAWDAVLAQDLNVTLPSFDAFIEGVGIPEGDMSKAHDASAAVISSYKGSRDKLNQTLPALPPAGELARAKTSCQVLKALKLPTDCK